MNSVTQGEDWSVNIVNAIIKSAATCSNGKQLWYCTQIFIYWDDPGGFYENVWNPDPYYLSYGTMRTPLNRDSKITNTLRVG
jgi:phospholipase C